MDGNCQKQFDAGFVHNLSDIQDLLDSALSNYDAKTSKTFMGPIRKAFRKLGGKNELAKGYLALAPQESHYLSIVCGGIKLILSAAARMAELQESVRKTMEDVPEIVKYFQRILALNVLPRAQNFKKRSNILDTYLPDLLGLSVTLKGADQDRAVWVMKSDVFMGWLSSPLSMPLLVNGKSRAPRNNRSPLTFVAAKLVESLERLRMSNQRTWTSGMKLIGLSFFCGEHEDETESENNNPLGLIQNAVISFTKRDGGVLHY
ncbi:hypothetical protein M7I_1677 [Glarea lozoyensis 74030]|uniref:Uncharacterized protein n=1 Tax=Glarea lozoyensis (strain ATCC 74030 / MF5533) TaxID=1104152 RepID=H0EGQ8_GLAL7|nr:hypothetical protein M7I_1677 [Glarea lozoyensis 74030]